jgi:hypothetical protein
MQGKHSRWSEIRGTITAVPETNPETALTKTVLTERDLIIHAVQHLEDLSEKVGEIYEALIPLRPLLDKLATRKRIFG